MKNNTPWLIQTILWDEIISKFKYDDLEYIDNLAWNYTQINQNFIPHKDIMRALETINKELLIVRDKYFKKMTDNETPGK